MNPKLEELLIARLSGNSQSSSTQDKLQDLYKAVMEKSQIKKFEDNFMASIKGSNFGLEESQSKNDYEAGLKDIFNKTRLIRAAGISMSTSISSLLPINLGSAGLGIRGISKMAAGFLIQKFAKGGSFGSFGEGVFDAGLALAVGGVIPANILSSISLGGNTTQTTTNNSGNSSQYLE